MLIVGTRGISELKGMFISSVSKYCLQHSPIPVVVVQPEYKVKKQQGKKSKKSKRLSGMFRRNSSDSSSDSSTSEDEVADTDKKVQRLSLFERIGRRSRSTSPARPPIDENSKSK